MQSNEAEYLIDVRPLLEALEAMKNGDLSVRLPDGKGEVGARLSDAFNNVVEMIGASHLALQEKAEQLALASKYKSEFMANMSHELRTPLNSLMILSQLLAENEEGNLNDAQVEFARTVHDSGNDLLLLINDILDLSKIESGAMQFDLTDIVLADLKDELERDFRHVADKKGLSFSVEISDQLIPTIYSDAKRVAQILSNLLSNAFKFTERGSVSMRWEPALDGWTAGRSALDDAKQVVAFSVTDTGIGIAAGKQKLIFEAFQQADGTTSRKYGGTGLGLAICKELASVLGGQVKVKSAEGAGSTFTLYLPDTFISRRPDAVKTKEAHKAPPAQAIKPAKKPVLYSEETTLAMHALDSGTEKLSDENLARSREILANRKILVVDDDLRNIFAIKSVLARQNARVMHADNGKDAIDTLVQDPSIDCVLMDIMMPQMDGYQAIREIRKLEQFKRLPIIALTARAMKGDRERCLDAGASDYISKPVESDNLISLLCTWLADPALK